MATTAGCCAATTGEAEGAALPSNNRDDRRIARSRDVPPPISPWTPVIWLVITGCVLAGVVFWVVPEPGPLDNPDQAEQRSGLLVPAAEAREVSGLQLPGSPIGQRTTVIVFDRSIPDPQRFRDWLAAVPTGTTTVLAVPQPSAGDEVDNVVTDPRRQIAEAVDMPTPVDGGYPIGYAVIDAEARVRYATLDPGYLSHDFAIATMAAVVQ